MNSALAVSASEIPEQGSGWTSPKTLLIPTLHPAFLLRGANHYYEVVVTDLKRAARIAEDGWHRAERIYTILPAGGGNVSVDWAVNWIWENFKAGKPAAIDTETYGVGKRDALDQYSCGLHAVGISFWPSNEALSFIADGTIGENETRRLLEATRAVMGGPNPKIFHNMAYDIEVLYRYGMPLGGAYYDNLVLHHITDPEQDHNLGFVSHQFLDIAAWKADFKALQRKKQAALANLVSYNARDALATQELLPILMQRVTEIEQGHVAQMDTQLAELSARMGRYGIPIGEDKRREVEARLIQKRDAALAFVRSTMAWPDFDPRKPSHRSELLYARLALPVKVYTTKKSLPSTSAAALVPHLGNEVIRALVDFDKNAKLVSTFIAKLPDLVDKYGRLHIHWKSTGTVGSRWSSEQPSIQNWPKMLRAIVQTREGRVLVGADSKAIEHRIMAARAGCKKLVEIFNDPSRDVHNETAADFFGEQFTKLEKKSQAWIDLRFLTKRSVYARNYRAKAETIYGKIMEHLDTPASIRATLTLGFVKEICKNFDRAFPEIGMFCEQEWERTNRLGYQEVPPIGRRRYHAVLPVEITLSSNNCVDDKTEALTLRGWVAGPNLKPDDYLLTKNHITGALEWQKPTAIHRFPKYRGPLYRFETKTMSAVTTPNHRWLVDTLYERSVCKTSAELSHWGNDRIHRTGIYPGAELKTYSDDFVELAAWTLTDGYIGHPNSGRTYISLFQSEEANPEKAGRIDELFVRLRPFVNAYVSYRNKVHKIWRFTGPTARMLGTIFPDRILTFDFLLRLTTSQLRLLKETMIDGDGTRCGGAVVFCAGTKAKADMFQTLCILCNEAASIRKVDFRKYVLKSKKMPNVPKSRCAYYVHVYKRTRAQLMPNTVRYFKNAKASLWCPSVPNGYFVARRAGRTYVTGNSIQFPAGDYQNLSMLAIDDELRRKYSDAHIILNVHDQIVVECRESDAPAIRSMVEEKMRHKVEGPAGHVWLLADASIARNWEKVS